MALDPRMQRELLAALAADPEAEAPKLVYADWLEDQGDPLAELVRIQVALARDDDVRTRAQDELAQRERQLLAELWPDRPARRPRDRFSKDRPIFSDWSYQIDRGLVTLCIHQWSPAVSTPQPPLAWFERFGWHAIRFESPEGDELPLDHKGLAALLDSPLLKSCLGLDLSRARLKIKAIRHLAQSPAVGSLVSLNLSHHLIGVPAATALATSPHLSELLALDLWGRKLGDAAVAALVGTGAFSSLRFLNTDSVGPAGIRTVANCAHLQHLCTLGLGGACFDEPSAKALAGSTCLAALTRLDLAGISKANLVAQALAAGAGLPNLREISFAWTSITDEGAEPLIRSPRRANLQAIDFDRSALGGQTGIKTETVRALAESDRFFRTGVLRLWACDLPDEALQPLAASPHAALLRGLSLGYSRITDAGARILAASPYLKTCGA
jgi:uncharacterized protein (TIGR02996 family)